MVHTSEFMRCWYLLHIRKLTVITNVRNYIVGLNAQTNKNLPCSYTKCMNVEEDSDKM